MKEIIFGLLVGLSIAKLSVLYLEEKPKEIKHKCIIGKPKVYFEYNGKWATAELLRLGESCYE